MRSFLMAPLRTVCCWRFSSAYRIETNLYDEISVLFILWNQSCLHTKYVLNERMNECNQCSDFGKSYFSIYSLFCCLCCGADANMRRLIHVYANPLRVYAPSVCVSLGLGLRYMMSEIQEEFLGIRRIDLSTWNGVEVNYLNCMTWGNIPDSRAFRNERKISYLVRLFSRTVAVSTLIIWSDLKCHCRVSNTPLSVANAASIEYPNTSYV